MAGSTGLEPAASAVTGQRSSQLNYDPKSDNQIRIADCKLLIANCFLILIQISICNLHSAICNFPVSLGCLGGAGLEPATAGV